VAKEAGEKTEAPTPKKKREARKEGNIPKSAELTSWSALLLATFLAPLTLERCFRLLDRTFARVGDLVAEPDVAESVGLLGQSLLGALLALAPFVAGLVVLGVSGNVVQVGWAPTWKTIKPQPKKISPKAGMKRIFSPSGVWEGGKAALKVFILASVSYGPLATITGQLAGGGLSLMAMLPLVGDAALTLARRIALAGLVLAGMDYAMQRRRVNKSIKMSKHEVKEEGKQSEGNPQLKGEIRHRQLTMSRNRMMAELPKADVVLVNPTHVAVALRYDPAAGAPRVVAKGAGVVATRIREAAAEHGIPLVTDVPLARTLHKLCEIGDEIPGDLYEAVARVLAFVFALKVRKASTAPLPVPVYQPVG
jgi:flagellar biosynthesis protein FlhB